MPVNRPSPGRFSVSGRIRFYSARGGQQRTRGGLSSSELRRYRFEHRLQRRRRRRRRRLGRRLSDPRKSASANGLSADFAFGSPKWARGVAERPRSRQQSRRRGIDPKFDAKRRPGYDAWQSPHNVLILMRNASRSGTMRCGLGAPLRTKLRASMSLKLRFDYSGQRLTASSRPIKRSRDPWGRDVRTSNLRVRIFSGPVSGSPPSRE